MSAADIERFVADLKENASLLDEAKAVSGGLAAMAEFAKSKGYDITVDEAKDYVNERTKQDLSVAELDAIAGGKKSSHSVATQVYEVQTVATTTTEAAEVETSAAAATQAVAVAVIVLT